VAAVTVRRRKAISGPDRVWLLNATLAVATGLALTVVARFASPPQDGPAMPWWFLAVGFGVAEIFVIHLRIRRHAHSFALSEIPLVLGLVFSPPGAVILAQAVGVGIVLATYRRQSPLRLSFNVMQRSFTASLAVFVFHGTTILVGGAWPTVWLAAFSAALIADVVGAILINTAISLSEGVWEIFNEVIGVGTAFTVANTALGLIAAMAIQQHPAAILLVALPAATTFLAGRAYAEVQLKHDNVVLLQRSTRLAQGSLQLAEMLPALLQHIREMFHADIAELTLWPDATDRPYLCSRVGPGEAAVVLEPADPDPTEGVWARVAAEREGVLLSRPIRNDRLAAHFAGRRIVDSIVVPVLSEDEVLGTMMVANRLGDFSTFGPEDLKLLDALGNHVGIAIRNTRLVNRLEIALAHETEMSKIKDDFVATISHELRTPLTNVKGYLKTLLGPIDLPAADHRDCLERADRATDRLQRLIEDLLFASSIESSRVRPPAEILSPSTLIEQLTDERRSRPHDPGRIDASVDPDVPAMRTHEEHVRRIVGNLLDNALKYSATTERVTIGCREDGGGVLFAIGDRGPGIPASEHHRVFDRFYQVDQSLTRRVGGTGMGLYIARRAAEILGGRVWLERSGPTGSTFCAWLPIEAPSAGGVPAGPRDDTLVVG
jgi:signal transduction histidine kinase